MSYGYTDTEEYRDAVLSVEHSLAQIASALNEKNSAETQPAQGSVYVLTIRDSCGSDIHDGDNLFTFSNFASAEKAMKERWFYDLKHSFVKGLRLDTIEETLEFLKEHIAEYGVEAEFDGNYARIDDFQYWVEYTITECKMR